MKILIVDDNKGFREALRFLLAKKSEYEVVGEAENGREAIEKLSEVLPDIVLMDIEMPELNGIEATKRILWDYPNIRFIAITMYRDRAYLSEMIAAGFKACVFKNNVSDQLEHAIQRVIDNKVYFPEDIKL